MLPKGRILANISFVFWAMESQENAFEIYCLLMYTYTYHLATVCTEKSLSEALLFAEYGENILCTEIVLNVRTISVHNVFSPCSAKRRASDKDLPVLVSVDQI